jgi:hypothetical protein
MNGCDSGGFYSATELREALLEDLLTQEEARLIYWSQFPTLRQQASITPPPIVPTAE